MNSIRGNYINGEFRKPQQIQSKVDLVSPADLKDSIGRLESSYLELDEIVSIAKEAQKKWKKTSIEERASYFQRYKEAILGKKEIWIQTISRETGKPTWETEGEFNSVIGKIDITLKEGLAAVQPAEIKDAAPGANGTYRFESLGVLSIIGPFNFPTHLPNGHLVPALLTGNSVIFKPSEKTPLSGQLLAECIHEAGFPQGVFQLLQGDREVSRRLCIHDGVSGVLFTGSYEVGLRIKQDTLSQHWKILALEMGGKNPAIVFEDADFDKTLNDILVSAYATAGQRCSATSRAIVHESLAEKFVSALHEKAKKFSIGHPFTNPFMGPLIDSASVDRYLKVQTMSQREGFELIMRGKALELEKKGHYVTPSISFASTMTLENTKKGIYQQTEWFAPNLAITTFNEPEEALAFANASQYGLVASVFTKSKPLFEKLRDDLEYGLVNWNRGTVGASSRLPFGGFKKSGNHRPTALFASQYCTHPKASLECETQQDATAKIPGLSF